MLVGSRRYVTSTARYRAVSESTADAASDDEDDKEYDDGRGGAAASSSSYESFGTCDLLLNHADDTRPTRSHPCTTGMQVFFVHYHTIGVYQP